MGVSTLISILSKMSHLLFVTYILYHSWGLNHVKNSFEPMGKFIKVLRFLGLYYTSQKKIHELLLFLELIFTNVLCQMIMDAPAHSNFRNL